MCVDAAISHDARMVGCSKVHFKHSLAFDNSDQFQVFCTSISAKLLERLKFIVAYLYCECQSRRIFVEAR